MGRFLQWILRLLRSLRARDPLKSRIRDFFPGSSILGAVCELPFLRMTSSDPDVRDIPRIRLSRQ